MYHMTTDHMVYKQCKLLTIVIYKSVTIATVLSVFCKYVPHDHRPPGVQTVQIVNLSDLQVSNHSNCLPSVCKYAPHDYRPHGVQTAQIVNHSNCLPSVCKYAPQDHKSDGVHQPAQLANLHDLQVSHPSNSLPT